MRTSLLAAVALGCGSIVSAQQQPPPKKPTTITMTGCVRKGETPAGGYTLIDGSAVYRLTGVDVRDFVGRRVQVVGGDSRKLKIVGGLLPSPNVAAQAGSMGPARPAPAAADAAAANGTRRPEFPVRS